ncbi:MAG: glycogen synthase GlgA [Gammaproteobacteria bacterium]|nr:glycogen synthase GlgA [Gammaproteobacteria bacterium]
MQYQHDKILFATSELFPLIKTGGLADVSDGLTRALFKKGVDIKVILPGYLDVKRQFRRLRTIAEFDIPFKGKLLEVPATKHRPSVILVDIPERFERSGGPYATDDGIDWPDNAQRYCAFSKIVVMIALGELLPDWRPDIVHCNDWQTALVPALLNRHSQQPKTLFTIHNLAYQGQFSYDVFKLLQLPDEFWSPDALEFYGQFSFIKGGLVYADKVNTVSPSYAKEITLPAFGYGLDGLLRHRQNDLCGITNGVDYENWNPQRDKHIEQIFSYRSISRKKINKIALQKIFGLPLNDETVLIGTIGRIVEQKGYDLILDALPTLLEENIQLVILGSGNPYLEARLIQAMQKYRGRLSVKTGYSETLAHQIEAGADIFLMPSRYEPCGLNQIYSQRYGTVPIVHHTGGLIDTVTDTNEFTLQAGTASGFHFYQPTPESLIAAVRRALALYRRPRKWRQLVRTGMQANYSWERTSEDYLRLYDSLHLKAGSNLAISV